MAFDAFLKLTDIKGESTSEKHKDEIEIQSFSWGVSHSGTIGSGGGGGAGKASAKDLLLTADSSKASPKLLAACVDGKHIKEGLLTLRTAGEEPTTFATIKVSDLLVAAYDQAAVPESGSPMDEFSLRYSRIEFTYNGESADFDVVKG